MPDSAFLCNGTDTAGGGPGPYKQLVTPNTDVNYPKDVHCTWTLHAAAPNQIITLMNLGWELLPGDNFTIGNIYIRATKLVVFQREIIF